MCGLNFSVCHPLVRFHSKNPCWLFHTSDSERPLSTISDFKARLKFLNFSWGSKTSWDHSKTQRPQSVNWRNSSPEAMRNQPPRPRIFDANPACTQARRAQKHCRHGKFEVVSLQFWKVEITATVNPKNSHLEISGQKKDQLQELNPEEWGPTQAIGEVLCRKLYLLVGDFLQSWHCWKHFRGFIFQAAYSPYSAGEL